MVRASRWNKTGSNSAARRQERRDLGDGGGAGASRVLLEHGGLAGGLVYKHKVRNMNLERSIVWSSSYSLLPISMLTVARSADP
jgi:hypothetical protein